MIRFNVRSNDMSKRQLAIKADSIELEAHENAVYMKVKCIM